MFRAMTLLSVSFFLSLGLSHGADIYVPDDQPTIQDAINTAVDGDSVIVRSGTYVENIDFLGKAVTVQSENGPDVTTIDGGRTASVVTFGNGEGPDSVLDGFTITNGQGSGFPPGNESGGGIYCESSSPVIKNSTIKDNEATGHGGGVCCCLSASPTVMECTISDNECTHYGGGVYHDGTSRSLVNACEVKGNFASFGGGLYGGSEAETANCVILGNQASAYGGGIHAGYGSVITNNVIAMNFASSGGGVFGGEGPETIVNNTIFGNTASATGGGIGCDNNFQSTVTDIRNSILWGNSAPMGKELYVREHPVDSADIDSCDIEGGMSSVHVEPGSYLNIGVLINADPLFVDRAVNDFHITYDSPCRSAGDRNAPGLPDTDFEGDPRTGLFAFPDIGADEFHTHFYVYGPVHSGSTATGVIVGWPQTNPLMLITGGGVLPEPDSTPYGDFWLMPPWKNRIHFYPMPDNGVRLIDGVVPAGLPPGTRIPMQVLVGTELSNLWVVEIE